MMKNDPKNGETDRKKKEFISKFYLNENLLGAKNGLS